MVSEDVAAVKAAYRFMENPHIDEEAILSGHFAATRDRIASVGGIQLVISDTTEVGFQRDRPEWNGVTDRSENSKTKIGGSVTKHTACAVLAHGSLVVTTDGLPLGFLGITFWTRQKFKGNAALPRSKSSSTRLPPGEKESVRWLNNLKSTTESFEDPRQCVHVCDREGDIYEMFCTALEFGGGNEYSCQSAGRSSRRR